MAAGHRTESRQDAFLADLSSLPWESGRTMTAAFRVWLLLMTRASAQRRGLLRRGGLAGEAGRDWRPRVRGSAESGAARVGDGSGWGWTQRGGDQEGALGAGRRAWTQAQNHRASREAGWEPICSAPVAAGPAE